MPLDAIRRPTQCAGHQIKLKTPGSLIQIAPIDSCDFDLVWGQPPQHMLYL